MAKEKRELSRTNMNLPTHVLKALDDYAAMMGLTRQAAATVLIMQQLKAQGTMDAVKIVADEFQKQQMLAEGREKSEN